MSYKVLGLGNPLLDIQVTGNEELLKKYDLKANDAILAEDKHMPIYEELVKMPVTYVAGGAAQNAIRGAQYILPANSTVYFGCVGDDSSANQLRAANDAEGVKSEYMVDNKTSTGVCGVIITEHHRSLVTHLGAANNYTTAHMSEPSNWAFAEQAEFFYVGGYHLTVCVDAIRKLGEEAVAKNKAFVMNLSAPFLCSFFKDQMTQVQEYWDYLIGNESEALAWAEAHGLETKDIAEIAVAIQRLPKKNTKRERVVVITQGPDETILVDGSKAPVKFPVNPIPEEKFVDTNGAGDAFSGGFLAYLVLGKPLEECVKAGQWLAALSIESVGPRFPHPKQTCPV